jgi:hypothetical protein
MSRGTGATDRATAAGRPLILGMLQRPGVYFYLVPFYDMGSKILWDGRDHLGWPFLDHFPPALVRAKNETEMQIELATAHRASSIFQVVGADQPSLARRQSLRRRARRVQHHGDRAPLGSPPTDSCGERRLGGVSLYPGRPEPRP